MNRRVLKSMDTDHISIDRLTALLQTFALFFATPFWKKLQSKNGQSCMSKKDNVATGLPGIM